jgi:NAD-dependent deacetylase
VPVPAELVEALRAAGHVLALTGSGVSAESGVPTFREAQTGLWENFNPLELATAEAFLSDPKTVRRWYDWRRDLVDKVEPNAGHYALARLADLVPAFTLVTQNVDGLHQRAGSRNVVEFHGNLFSDRCFSDDCPGGDVDASGDLPTCALCGSPIRPGVVWFGEAIPPSALQATEDALRSCDVFMSIGTSSQVWPAAGLAEAARANGATILEINLEATPVSSDSHFCLRGKSGEILPELVDCLAV